MFVVVFVPYDKCEIVIMDFDIRLSLTSLDFRFLDYEVLYCLLYFSYYLFISTALQIPQFYFCIWFRYLDNNNRMILDSIRRTKYFKDRKK